MNKLYKIALIYVNKIRKKIYFAFKGLHKNSCVFNKNSGVNIFILHFLFYVNR